MIVITKRVGEPYRLDIIGPRAVDLAEEIGGIYEIMPLYEDFIIVRRRGEGYQPNALIRTISGEIVVCGDFIICREEHPGKLRSIGKTGAGRVVEAVHRMDLHHDGSGA